MQYSIGNRHRPMIGAIAIAVVMSCACAASAGGAVEGLLADYRTAGATEFDATRGQALWQRSVTSAKDGKQRSCTTCHGADLTRPGKHARTGKTIEPMAPSANDARLSDAKKVEKWFRRNCKWTFGRVCTPQEKGDILSYLSGQ